MKIHRRAPIATVWTKYPMYMTRDRERNRRAVDFIAYDFDLRWAQWWDQFLNPVTLRYEGRRTSPR